MKRFFILMAVAALVFTACNDSDETPAPGGSVPSSSGETIDATYSGESFDNEEAATYFVNFQSKGFDMDDDTEEITSGPDSYTLCLNFSAAFAEDSDHAVLPSGTYTGDDNCALGTFLTNSEYDCYLIHVVDGATVWEGFTGGTVTVSNKNGVYDISCDLTLASGEPYKYSYKGEIIFHNRTSEGVTSTLTGDVNIPKLTKAYAVMVGESLFESEDSTTAFMVLGDDNFDTDLLLGWGHGLTVYFNVPLDATTIPDGTYNMNTEEVVLGALVPGMSMWGLIYGCWYFQGQHEALLCGGSVEVEHSGEIYTVTIALKDGHGHTVSGQYKGKLPVYEYAEE